MKSLTYSILIVFFSSIGCLVAQEPASVPSNLAKEGRPMIVAPLESFQPLSAEEMYQPARRLSAIETEIGNSRYDLQTNASIQRRIVIRPNGSIAAVWTFSAVNTWTTRGTGYNYFNGSSWGTAPTAPLESERVGWPSLLHTQNGNELIIAHSTASFQMIKNQRNAVGSGSWSESSLSSLDIEWWNRAASSGNDVHMIGVTRDAGNGGSLYNGLDVALLYNKSNDAGQTWNIQNYQLPGTDSSYTNGFGPDNYAIDAKGDTVAIVVGVDGRGVQLYKSTDGGINWTKKDVLKSDLWFEETETFVDNTAGEFLYTSDGSVSVLLDDDGMAHVWYGSMFIANTDLTDGVWSYFPATNGMDYWNENYPEGAPVFLTSALDYDGNGVVDLVGGTIEAIGLYYVSLSSQPQAGIDANGCIYLSYAALHEGLTNGSQNYRHVYVMRSCDGGCSWSYPIDVTGAGANDFSECVFPSIARRVDTAVHILYQSDNEPGIAVQGDMDAVTNNAMIYLKESTERFDTATFCPTGISGDTLLCSGGSLELIALGCASGYNWSGPSSFSSTAMSVNVTEPGTYTCTITTSCGNEIETHTVVANTGQGPFWNTIDASSSTICSGETVTLSVTSNIAGVSYAWSANAGSATTQSVQVTSAGLYSVTVTDCNANSEVLSIQLSQPAPPTSHIDGDLTICTGGSTTLSAAQVLGADYAWSTGDVTQSIQVNSTGTYTCTVTNCAGSASSSVTVTAEPLPVAAVDAPQTEACEGDQLTVTATGGATYSWSSGETTPSISITQPSQSGTYSVTVYNECGDEDVASVTLTIHENPSAPVVTVDGLDYVSSQSGGGTHQWFVNGSPQSETSNVLTGLASWAGSSVTCIYTDENGCISPESDAVLNVAELHDGSTVDIYPNPNDGRFELRVRQDVKSFQLEISDVTGRTVLSDRIQNSDAALQIDLSGFDAGVYTVKLGMDGMSVTEQVVIE